MNSTITHHGGVSPSDNRRGWKSWRGRPFTFRHSFSSALAYARHAPGFFLILALSGCTLFGAGEKRAVLPDPGHQGWQQNHNITEYYDQGGAIIRRDVRKVENADVQRPQAPDESASFARAADGALTMSTGSAHKPVILSESWYANPILWIGAGSFLVGVVLLFARRWPALAWMPKGMSHGLIVGGVGLLAISKIVTSLFGAIILALVLAGVIAFVSGALDNVQFLKRSTERQS